MSSAIPSPLRAAAGLAAVAIDEARRLPNRVIGLPVMVASSALQASMRAQQHYAELVIRGDELITALYADGHGEEDEADPAARFDEDEDDEPVAPLTAPVDGYDDFTIPQLRARLRRLSAEQLEALLAYEQTSAHRPAYLTMLTNRLETLSRG